MPGAGVTGCQRLQGKRGGVHGEERRPGFSPGIATTTGEAVAPLSRADPGARGYRGQGAQLVSSPQGSLPTSCASHPLGWGISFATRCIS